MVMVMVSDECDVADMMKFGEEGEGRKFEGKKT